VLVPADAPGFSRGPAETYMSGEKHAALYFDDCRVPRDHVLVESDALRQMFTIFGIERIGNAVRALSLAQAAFDLEVEHAKVRRQFDRPLCEFQGLQWKFADMKMKLDAARLLIYRAVTNADGGAPSPAEATIAKCYTNEIAFEVANDALQACGAMGYSTEEPMEYYVRRIRGWMIAGGSVEMIPNAVAIAELAVEKQAKVLLMPVSARRGLNDLPDDLWTKISIEFSKDPEDAVFKGLEE
jgi:alkylation response protein AidB-like acyl-CoA dehydrogenase